MEQETQRGTARPQSYTPEEYRRECVRLTHLRLSIAFVAMRDAGEDAVGTFARASDIERILSGAAQAPERELAVLRREEALHRRRTQLTLRGGESLPMEAVAAAFSLTKAQRFLLTLALAMELDPQLERVVAYLQQDPAARAPTLGLGLRLFGMTGDVAEADVVSQDSFFRRLLLPAPQDMKPALRPMRLHPRVLAYLLGSREEPACLEGIAKRHDPQEELPELMFSGEILEDIVRTLALEEGGVGPMLLLRAERGAGKRLLLRHAARRLKKPLLLIEWEALQGDPAHLEEAAADILRECALLGALIALRLPKPPEEEKEALLQRLLSSLGTSPGALFLLCDAKWPEAARFADGRRAFLRMEIPPLNAMQRKQFWRALPGMDEFDVDLDLLANKYSFTPGVMLRACEDARRIARWSEMRGKGADELFSAACRQQLVHNMGSYATLLTSPFQWDDLVLPPDRKAQLAAICAQVRNHHTVFEAWEMSRRVPYGKGLSALFTGQPGTGKTMAAQVIANQLGIEIYQVNLSAVVSKYIGETEKNLEVVFEEGAKSHCILFFDEADALFAKRTELKDANDRFANAESAYLLQRIENYPGIVLLATNYAQNFDPAFRRRIKYTVDFPIPDFPSRLLMWEKILAPPVPVDGSVDLEALAERFELTGSGIKNVALNAAFAAAQEGCDIRLSHIQQAMRVEFSKSGRVVDTAL